MFKRSLIVSFFFLAYTIVLAHSIVPHHHHNPEITQSLANPLDDHHQHDNESDDDGSLSHEFAKYLHSSGPEDIYQKNDLKLNYNFVATACIATVFEFVFNQPETSQLVGPFDSDQIPVSTRCLSPKGLRAPPVV